MSLPEDLLPAPSPDMIARQNALFDWHTQWTSQYVDALPFSPDEWPADSDYNQHTQDVEASAAASDVFHMKAREILGLPPLDQVTAAAVTDMTMMEGRQFRADDPPTGRPFR